MQTTFRLRSRRPLEPTAVTAAEALPLKQDDIGHGPDTASAGSLTSSTAAWPSIGAPLGFCSNLMCLLADR
jgi:hypothetical protein